jgi:hypothetical protein
MPFLAIFSSSLSWVTGESVYKISYISIWFFRVKLNIGFRILFKKPCPAAASFVTIGARQAAQGLLIGGGKGPQRSLSGGKEKGELWKKSGCTSKRIPRPRKVPTHWRAGFATVR